MPGIDIRVIRSHLNDAATEGHFARWVTDYDAATRTKAVCRFVEAVGGDDVAPAIRPIVERHDEVTRADSTLALGQECRPGDRGPNVWGVWGPSRPQVQLTSPP